MTHEHPFPNCREAQEDRLHRAVASALWWISLLLAIIAALVFMATRSHAEPPVDLPPAVCMVGLDTTLKPWCYRCWDDKGCGAVVWLSSGGQRHMIFQKGTLLCRDKALLFDLGGWVGED